MGLLTLLSMAKIWTTAFWGDDPGIPPAKTSRAGRALELAPVALLALVAVALGLLAGPALEVSERAASELLDPTAYVDALRRSAP